MSNDTNRRSDRQEVTPAELVDSIERLDFDAMTMTENKNDQHGHAVHGQSKDIDRDTQAVVQAVSEHLIHVDRANLASTLRAAVASLSGGSGPLDAGLRRRFLDAADILDHDAVGTHR